MSELEQRLKQARNGRGMLFCGAGFSADCLNFDGPTELGTSSQLLSVLNKELEALGASYGFKEIRNAADEYQRVQGEHGLLQLLCNRFRLNKISSDMTDIMRFPWKRIYTTNYDNGIELALQSAGKKAIPVNNLDDPNKEELDQSVIHIHGYIEKWDIENFSHSCVLGEESYYRISALKNWFDIFRDDVNRASMVVFVGFNSQDFHLNQILFNISILHEKIYFVNRPAARPDPDVQATQTRFGLPLYIGRQGLATSIRHAVSAEPSDEPTLASFRRYVLPKPSSSVPSVGDIEDLFIFGRVVPEHLARDIADGRLSGGGRLRATNR